MLLPALKPWWIRVSRQVQELPHPWVGSLWHPYSTKWVQSAPNASPVKKHQVTGWGVKCETKRNRNRGDKRKEEITGQEYGDHLLNTRATGFSLGIPPNTIKSSTRCQHTDSGWGHQHLSIATTAERLTCRLSPWATELGSSERLYRTWSSKLYAVHRNAIIWTCKNLSDWRRSLCFLRDLKNSVQMHKNSVSWFLSWFVSETFEKLLHFSEP